MRLIEGRGLHVEAIICRRGLAAYDVMSIDNVPVYLNIDLIDKEYKCMYCAHHSSRESLPNFSHKLKCRRNFLFVSRFSYTY